MLGRQVQRERAPKTWIWQTNPCPSTRSRKPESPTMCLFQPQNCRVPWKGRQSPHRQQSAAEGARLFSRLHRPGGAGGDDAARQRPAGQQTDQGPDPPPHKYEYGSGFCRGEAVDLLVSRRHVDVQPHLQAVEERRWNDYAGPRIDGGGLLRGRTDASLSNTTAFFSAPTAVAVSCAVHSCAGLQM